MLTNICAEFNVPMVRVKKNIIVVITRYWLPIETVTAELVELVLRYCASEIDKAFEMIKANDIATANEIRQCERDRRSKQDRRSVR